MPENGEEEEECGRFVVRRIIADFRGHVDASQGPGPGKKIPEYNLEEHDGPGESTAEEFNNPGKRYSPTMLPCKESSRDLRFKGRFPHQHVSVSCLLGSNSHQQEVSRWCGETQYDNILSKRSYDLKDPTRLKYIHLPANNMKLSRGLTQEQTCNS